MGDVTRALTGDPPPGRTPWAAPATARPTPAKTVVAARPSAYVSPDEEPQPKGPRPLGEVEADLRAGRSAGHFADVGKMGSRAPADAPSGRTVADDLPFMRGSPEGDLPVETLLDLPSAVDALRPVSPLDLGNLQVQVPSTPPPLIEWMAPGDLLIDGAYQRDLSDKSLKLIRRIVEEWDWRRFKPPIVAWTDRGFEIIDGQHTATAAATLGVEKIPVLVVEAAAQTDRAGAFIGHNRDRLAVTPGQLHHAAVAAADPDAVQVQAVCDRAGVTLLHNAYGSRSYKPGDSMAVSAIGGLVKRRGDRGAREVLEVLVQSGQAPVTANAIKAVELLMFDEPYAGQFEPEELAKAIQKTGSTAERDARLATVAQAIPLWKGLAATWFRKTRKRREP